MSQRPVSTVTRLGLAAGLAAAFALTAGAADTRDETVRALEGIQEADVFGLEAWLQTNTPYQIRVGDEVAFRFRSASDVYLTTIYVDARGAVAILHSGDALLAAEEELAFPPPDADQIMVAQPPLGAESVFAIATAEPLSQTVFLDEEGRRQDGYDDPQAAHLFAQRLAAHLAERHAKVDTATFTHQIVAADAPRHYTAAHIVEHFETRTRSLTRPKLQLDIQFEFGSDQLTDAARYDLDELGKALQHPAMKRRRFELAGHTDDVGEAGYNMDLSKRRADSARAYLLSKYGVDATSIETAGYGEDKPLVRGTSEEARRRNRRVVIEQLP